MIKEKTLFIWLSISAFMIVVMVFIGGWTRLADAGLSITEWKPVTGIVPPLTETLWEEEFAKYKASPEFQKIHTHFTLIEFKQIFWLEFIHRILGRITGLVILLPGLFFYLRGYFKEDLPSYLSIMFLIAFQGFIGWWMVKSGLVDNPHVSHFRLATHLLTALLLYCIILWKIFGVKGVVRLSLYDKPTHIYAMVTTVMLYLQIALGALVAGLDAGMIYNTFPLMGGSFIPSEIYKEDIWYDPASIQFFHRCGAYMVGLLCLVLGYKLWKSAPSISLLLVSGVSIQFILGILTVLYVVPIKLALAHQLFAVLLLGITTYVLYKTRR